MHADKPHITRSRVMSAHAEGTRLASHDVDLSLYTAPNGRRGFGGALARWRDGERGMSEVAAAIFIMPFLFTLIMVSIEFGFNLRTRALVDNAVLEATRGVAMDGGNINQRTASLGLGRSWSQSYLLPRLDSICANGGTRRCNVISYSCNPPVALNPGDDVTCNAEVQYVPVIAGLRNPVASLGFSQMFNAPIRAKAFSRSGTAG